MLQRFVTTTHAGTLIGLVADDESISLPLTEPSEAERFLGTVRTVDDLRKEAAKQPVVIDQAVRVG